MRNKKGDCRLEYMDRERVIVREVMGSTRKSLTAAAIVAGEDLACGDYVSLLNETVDFPSFLWDSCGATLSPYELVRLKVIPVTAGRPWKVIAISSRLANALVISWIRSGSPGIEHGLHRL